MADNDLFAVALSNRPPTPPAHPPTNVPTATWGPIHAKRKRTALGAVVVFVAALVACLLAYAALTVPGAWFPPGSPKSWTASALTLARGTGQLVGDELVVTAPGADDLVVVTVPADLRSSDCAVIAWIGVDVSDMAMASLLWRTDRASKRLNQAQVHVESGHLMPVLVTKDPAWVGRITGLALAIRGPLSQPLRLRGVVAKPLGLMDTLRDAASEWFAFEGWTGASINTVIGGADNQDLPLPLLLAVAVGVAGGIVMLIHRLRPASFAMTTAGLIVAFFLASWLLLDMRWTWNLVRQVGKTTKEFAFETTDEKHNTAEDAALYAFVNRARKVLPAEPARIIVFADADYYRGRAAYYLYPHNVYFEPRRNVLPQARMLRPGDWLLVYQARGIQYDAAQQKLRWNGAETISAEFKMAGPGGALFLIR